MRDGNSTTAIPLAVVLSVMRGVALCGYPRSERVNRIGVPIWPFKKSAARSDSEAEETTVG